MKKVWIIFLLQISGFGVFAQTGFLRTYEDYINKKVEKEYFNVTPEYEFGLTRIEIGFVDKVTHEVEFIALDRDSMWGYMSKGNSYRLVSYGNPLFIIENGPICLYGDYSTEIKKDHIISASYSVSVGIHGETYYLTSRKLKKLLLTQPKGEEFIKKYPLKGRKQKELYGYILRYNDFVGGETYSKEKDKVLKIKVLKRQTKRRN